MFSASIQHFAQTISTLNVFEVQYIVVGGTAIGFYGHDRLTTDLHGIPTDKFDYDFWYNPTYENYFNVLRSMKSLGKDVEKLQNEAQPNPKRSFLKFEFTNFKIDMLPAIKGLESFGSSWQTALRSKINNQEFRILSLDDLIKSKEIQSRPKDIADLIELRKLRDNH